MKLKHQFRLWLLAVAPAIGSVSIAMADGAQQPPNFVFMYTDDQQWGCLGVVQREQGEHARFPWLQTPHLDKLAAESVRFNQSFVVNSLCAPGRACVLTGRYSHMNGVFNNSTPFPVDSDTYARRLQQAGYTTAYCGKWHMDQQRVRPGFDFVASFVGQGKYFDCPILVSEFQGGDPGKKPIARFGELQQMDTKGWIDDVSTERAIEFVEKQPKDKPFFLFLGFKSPHGPRGGQNLPEKYRNLYANEQSRDVPNLEVPAIYQPESKRKNQQGTGRAERQAESHREYMQHITAIDDCVGRVLDSLQHTGRVENTVVFFSTDNGYYLGEHGLGDKRTAYDESLRVPLLVRLPGNDAPRGVVNDQSMVLNIDYAPTILDLASASPLPEAQGRSFRPLLSNHGQSAPWREAFFYEYFREEPYDIPTTLAVRTTTHKLITYPGHDEWTELFDLAHDPYEMKNLVSDTALLARMRSIFDEQAKAVAFQMPPSVPAAHKPSPREAR